MYSRSLDPRRVPSALPSHYSGSAFRADGTPMSIPVKREHDPSRGTPAHDPLHEENAEHSAFPAPLPISEETNDEGTDIPISQHEDDCREDRNITDGSSIDDPHEKKQEHEEPFLSRLLGGLLPGIREDDLLLLLLILLLSREDGNEDILLLLAFLLLGK